MRMPDAIHVRRRALAGGLLALLALLAPGCSAPAPEAAPDRTEAQSLAVTPEVRALEPKVEGALRPAAVTEVIRANLDPLEDCYAKALGRNPKAAGRVVIHFIIDSEGKVARASVGGSQVHDKLVGRCFTKAIARLEFAEPDDRASVDVMQPFALAPRVLGAAPAEAANQS